MQLISFEKLFDICKEFSKNHKQYGFNDEFDIQITVNPDRTYYLTLDFSELNTQVHIEPNLDYPVSVWVSSPDDWIYENDRSVIITDWILENKEVFGISKSNCDETSHYRCLD